MLVFILNIFFTAIEENQSWTPFQLNPIEFENHLGVLPKVLLSTVEICEKMLTTVIGHQGRHVKYNEKIQSSSVIL